MRKSVMQVYVLRCDAHGSSRQEWQQKAFDLVLCENIPCVHAGFETVFERRPEQNELFSGSAQQLLNMLSGLPDTVENVLIAASEELIKAFASFAVETPLADIPLQTAPFHYAHLQWGSARCPGKWFLQRWNTKIPQ